MKFTNLIAASLLAMAAVPAAVHAQAADAGVVAGATVYAQDGSEVGTIDSVSGGNVVLNTGTNKAALPATSFVKGPKGPLFGMTKQQLDDAVNKANAANDAKLATALVAGAALYSSDGVQVGKIREIGADGNVVVEHGTSAFAFPKAQFTVADSGNLALHITAAQLDAALKQSAPAAASTGG